MYALVVTTENEIRRIEYDPPHYDVLREAVGGWYEHVHPLGLNRPYSMMVNEEGLLLKLPTNMFGSFLYGTMIHGQPIAGNIVIVKDGYHDGEPDVVGMDAEEARGMGDEFIKITYGKVRWATN